MNIVFLHTDFRLYWLSRLRYLSAFLQKQGHHLLVIEIAGKGSPYAFSNVRGNNDVEGWTCLFSDKTMDEISPKQARKAIFQKLAECSPDIVFAGAIAYPSGASAVAYCRTHKIPLVIFDDARLQDVPRNGLINFIKRLIYQNVDAVLIPAPSHIPDFEFFGIKKNQMYMGLNVVDNDFWKQLSLDSQRETAVWKKLNIPKRYVLGVGRQIAKKNWLSLLKAYSAQKHSFSLLLVGNGPERSALEQYISDTHLQDSVKLIDFQPPEVLALLYKNAMATILPSYYGETWGLTINEAMACGSPVIVSSMCGCYETLCQNGITGFKVTPEPESIEIALNQLSVLSENKRKEMGKNAEALIADWGVQKFSQSVLQAAETLYSQKTPGFHSPLSRIVIVLWKGRYRPV